MSEQIVNEVDNKRIAKNTVSLYFRMMLIMGVTLFTQRVVLDKLGATDYGIYYAVAGVVSMLGFLNGTLSTGTSRFLTFELGRCNFDKLKETFSTAFYSHLILALIVVVLLETIGMWFIYNKMLIPNERFSAAIWVFHFSIFTTFISITQVPYTSVIIAREKMNIYAVIGIFEAIAKLGIVYLLSLSSWDKLIFYAILFAAVQLVVACWYRIYCIHNYRESHLNLSLNKSILKEMLGFSGWGFLSNVSQILSTQGLTVLINMFFQPVVVAAQSIGNQISGAIMQFVNNFRIAINPQIIKLYSTGQYVESRKLTLDASIYTFELVLLMGLPIIVLMEPLLNLWLVDVPEYTVIFSQYIVATQIFNIYNGTLYMPMIASGRLKENSYISFFIALLSFCILYLMFSLGWNILWVQYVSMGQIIIASFIVKPCILCKYIPDYNWTFIVENIWQCLKVAFIPVSISIIIYLFWPTERLSEMIIVALLIIFSVCISSLIFMDRETRYKLFLFIKKKIQK